MLRSLIIAIGLTVVLVLAWGLVQALWKNTFREEYTEEDVLAGRRSCSNCGCTTACANKEKGRFKAREKNKIEKTLKINYRTYKK